MQAEGRAALRALVTTPRRPKRIDVSEARAEATRLGLPYVERGGLSFERFAEQADVVLLAARGDRALWLPALTQPYRFHGGMAVLRIRRLCQAVPEADPFLTACDIRPGDTVLDATGGACGDALVAAHAVGPAGKVIVAEASPLLHAVMGHGVRKIRFGEKPVDEALDRMEVHLADHADLLRSLPDRSVDVIYFDPMFRETTKAAPGFDVIRTLADPRPLERAVIDEALRVARRRVVIQDHKNGGELERLGVPELPIMGRRAPVRFGVIEIEQP